MINEISPTICVRNEKINRLQCRDNAVVVTQQGLNTDISPEGVIMIQTGVSLQ